MQIINKTSHSILIRDVIFADSLLKKTRGLIGKPKHLSLVFKTRFGIHTFGMSYPITVIILDKRNVVRKVKENLLPNKIFFWNPQFPTIIETSKPCKAKVGDQLTFVSS